jgi:transcriptional regulator with XRE-family HTH domain
MDSFVRVENYGAMPAARRPQYKKLYLGQWLSRLGRRPVDLARELDMTESYVSNLISGKKTGPTVDVLLRTSEWLGITVNDLFRPPPAAAAIEDLRAYSPGAVEQLLSPKPPK